MDLYEAIFERRAVHQYLDKPVEKEKLERILKAGTFAPTGMNRQSPIIVCIQDKETIEQLRLINAISLGLGSDRPTFHGADTLVSVFGDPAVASTWKEDATLVIGNIMLAAYAEGIGSCWIHRAKEMYETEYGMQLRQKWGIPASCIGVGNCILGYEKGAHQSAKKRKENYIIWDDKI